MYVPAHFAESRPEVLAELIRRHPFATMVTAQGGIATADHLPFILRPLPGEIGVLAGHVARANPVWNRATSGSDVLVIFQGAEHYISPRWYPSKVEHGKVVPTWNYAVVHVRGMVIWHDSIDWLRSHLSELTAGQEAGAAGAWRLEDAPEEYLKRMMSGIVGLEISIKEVIGKWKLSQNRHAADRQGVMAGLTELGTESAIRMRDLVSVAERKGDV
jgi:transcriptional regulator